MCRKYTSANAVTSNGSVRVPYVTALRLFMREDDFSAMHRTISTKSGNKEKRKKKKSLSNVHVAEPSVCLL